MYQQLKNPDGSTVETSIFRVSDKTCIPFDLANTDYQQFKIQVASGTELQDPDGNIMTPDAVKAFLATLP